NNCNSGGAANSQFRGEIILIENKVIHNTNLTFIIDEEESPFVVPFKACQGTAIMRKKVLCQMKPDLNFLVYVQSTVCDRKLKLDITLNTYPHSETRWWQHHAVEMLFFSSGRWIELNTGQSSKKTC
ncbi:hypothetical protein CHARACLAT_001910, partial [Characodon lateralis]|nr:hypothetical protein [Characodon lateralis]